MFLSSLSSQRFVFSLSSDSMLSIYGSFILFGNVLGTISTSLYWFAVMEMTGNKQKHPIYNELQHKHTNTNAQNFKSKIKT